MRARNAPPALPTAAGAGAARRWTFAVAAALLLVGVTAAPAYARESPAALPEVALADLPRQARERTR